MLGSVFAGLEEICVGDVDVPVVNVLERAINMADSERFTVVELKSIQ